MKPMLCLVDLAPSGGDSHQPWPPIAPGSPDISTETGLRAIDFFFPWASLQAESLPTLGRYASLG